MRHDVAASIRDKIRSGVLPLPADAPQKCYVGMGTNHACDACDEVITAERIEYELDIADRSTLRFHDTCLATWQTARAERMAGVTARAAEP